jgi:hypothetical protein
MGVFLRIEVTQAFTMSQVHRRGLTIHSQSAVVKRNLTHFPQNLLALTYRRRYIYSVSKSHRLLTYMAGLGHGIPQGPVLPFPLGTADTPGRPLRF